MRVKKTGEEKRMQKLRAALRLVWSRDYTRKEMIDAVTLKDPELGGKGFTCPVCKHDWPIDMATRDHNPQLGEFHTLEEAGEWMIRLFRGHQDVICKLCHKRITAQQRRKNDKSKLSTMPSMADKT
jgi:hypothetical protein